MKKITITVPVPTGLLRYWKWGLLALLALAVTLTWGYDTARRTEATTGDAAIAIGVVDAKFQTVKVPGTCWLVGYVDPILGNVVHDEVGDDGKPCPGSTGKLVDQWPGPGWLYMVVPKAQLKQFGPVWHVQQSQAPWGYQLDPTKYECDFSFLPMCEVYAKNAVSGGTLNVVVTDKADGSLVGDPVQCVTVYGDPPLNMPPGSKFCDGDPNDKDPDVGEISVSEFAFGVTYGVELQLSNTPPGRVFDESQGPAKQFCALANTPIEARKCTVSFSYILLPQINITNYARYALPKSCFNVMNEAKTVGFFQVCDNDFQAGMPQSNAVCIPDGICNDEDPDDGLVRVSVAAGQYSLEMGKWPYLHQPDPSNLACDTKLGKCELTFVNQTLSQPWFPWDVAGSMGGPPDGQVDLFNDILGVIDHWNDTKP